MTTKRKITADKRRASMARRHHLAGDAPDPLTVSRDLLALHATDPATVYLSVLARSEASTLGDVRAAMYERRELVRWMAMRRTLFVFDVRDVPMIQAAVSSPLAETLRRRLLSRMTRNGTEPAIEGDAGRWLGRVEAQVGRAVAARGSATGRELAEDVPGLGTTILARAASEQPQKATSPLLTAMSAAGEIVRGTPTGAWTSRHHEWEPVSEWWPEGLPRPDADAAASALARRWLELFGPATVEDLQWWTGWSKRVTLAALASLEIEEVDLEGRDGIDLERGGAEPVGRADSDLAAGNEGTSAREAGASAAAGPAPPVAALLPALDPTPMGWKERDWLFAFEPDALYDRARNLGPTLWWDGEIVGSWAVAPSGEIRTRIVADRGAEARDGIEAAAARLHSRLEGAVVTPAARTPMERELSA